MWFWVITFVTVGGLAYQIICKYRFARMQDAQQHLADNQEGVWQMVQEQGGIGMSEIEVVFEPKVQEHKNGEH